MTLKNFINFFFPLMLAESCDVPKNTSEPKSTSLNGDGSSETGIPACQAAVDEMWLWRDLHFKLNYM